jgi:hypothetical protein
LQQMTVVVEFDSCAIALAAYESADFKTALVALGSGERDFRIVEGAEPLTLKWSEDGSSFARCQSYRDETARRWAPKLELRLELPP